MSRTQSCRYPLKVKLYQTVHLVGQVFRRPLERFRFLAEEDDLLLTTDSVQDVQDFVLRAPTDLDVTACGLRT
tara:strand:- start:253 stop:471 length:219 start_codon:yes stop_codon:yes gene_type:complete